MLDEPFSHLSGVQRLGEEETHGELNRYRSACLPQGRSPTVVGHLVPVGFQAYCRILQPVQAPEPDDWWRWSKVAELANITAEPGFVRKLHNALPGNRLNELGIHPLVGEMHLETVKVLLEHFLILSPAETECLFYFWSGRDIGRGMKLAELRKVGAWGDLARFNKSSEKLYRGPLAYMTRFTVERGGFFSPSACWPEGMDWLFAMHTDAIAGYVGGPQTLVTGIVEDDRLEATPVSRQTKIDDWTDWLPF